MSRKNIPSVLSERRRMWRLTSSPILYLERRCVRDVLLTDQGNRRCLLDGFITRWFDAFGSEATQANRVGSSTPTMVHTNLICWNGEETTRTGSFRIRVRLVRYFHGRCGGIVLRAKCCHAAEPFHPAPLFLSDASRLLAERRQI